MANPFPHPDSPQGPNPQPKPNQYSCSNLQPNPQASGAPGGGAVLFANLDSTDIVALVLTIFFPGVGQIILGQVKKGVLIIALVMITCGIGGYIAMLFIAMDVLCLAQARKVRAVSDWEFFPDHVRVLGV